MENWEWVRRRNEGKRVLGNVVIRHTLRKINKGGKRFCIIPVFFNLVIFFLLLCQQFYYGTLTYFLEPHGTCMPVICLL